MARPGRRSPERRPDYVEPLRHLEGLLLLSMPTVQTLLDPVRAEARERRWHETGGDLIATYGRERCADPLARYGEPSGPRRTPSVALLTRRASPDSADAASVSPGAPAAAQDGLGDIDADDELDIWHRIEGAEERKDETDG